MNKKRAIMVLTIIAIFSISTMAMAGWGRGNGRMGGAYGTGTVCPYGGYGPGYNGSLSAEELEKLNKDQAAYYKETEGLRQKLYQKNLELRSELAKTDPDTQKASTLQADISKLQGELDQKRLSYQMKSGNPAPYGTPGFRGRGGMRGYGAQGGSGKW